MNRVPQDLLDLLVCPISGDPLFQKGDCLLTSSGRSYPVIEGVPVLLNDDAEQTHHVARASLDRTAGKPGAVDTRAPQLYLETLGISADQKDLATRLYMRSSSRVAIISTIIAATSGYGYAHLIRESELSEMPIPTIPLQKAKGEILLDVGCNWGRWTIAAARQGYFAIGIDPSLGSVLAAKDLCKELKVHAHFVVADARYLPFRPDTFDVAFSYSVLQHLSEPDVETALASIAKTTREGGTVKIQMAAKYGVRSLQHQLRRRFETPKDFQVRYWSVPHLRKTYSRIVGETNVVVDCYFGLGWQFSDWSHIRPVHRPILLASEVLRRLSYAIPPIRYVADSVFLVSRVR